MIDNDSPRNLISEKHAAIKITNSNKFGCGSLRSRLYQTFLA